MVITPENVKDTPETEPNDRELALWEKMGIHRDYHDPNGYAIRCGYIYPIYRTVSKKGKVIYRFKIKSGIFKDAYKIVSFSKTSGKVADYPSGTLIRPLRLLENFYYYEGNPYVPVFTIVLIDWEVYEYNTVIREREREEIFNDYDRELVLKNIDFDGEDLPF